MSRPKAPTFKVYQQHQMYLLPPSFEELIPANHPVRVVNSIVDSLDLKPLVDTYKGGGTSSYHPSLLLKVIIYAYLRNIFSTRKMEEALSENIHFMWLAGNTGIDHNTIARFRAKRLSGLVRGIFSQVVELLVEAGLVSLKDAYIDGTKIEANANRYTFVWGKSIKTNKEKMRKQLNDLLDYAETIAETEINRNEVFEEISAEKVEAAIQNINGVLKGKKIDPKVKQKLNYARKNWPSSLRRYKQQEELLGERNSFSKTDSDATFMRMKEDHMGNGQLKAGYNVQVSTENQFLTNYSVHHNPTDTKTLAPHLDLYEQTNGQLPEAVITDAGYGSEQNYEMLESKDVKAFVKFSRFDSENNKPFAPTNPDGWIHNEVDNSMTCSQGRKLVFESKGERITDAGYRQQYEVYRSQSCQGCPIKESCAKDKEEKRVQINHRLRHHKEKIRERLNSSEGIEKRRRRAFEVETVFAEWKQNKGFRQFNLRSMGKVEIEIGLLALVYNLKKLAI